jgi:hypothetical protein
MGPNSNCGQWSARREGFMLKLAHHSFHKIRFVSFLSNNSMEIKSKNRRGKERKNKLLHHMIFLNNLLTDFIKVLVRVTLRFRLRLCCLFRIAALSFKITENSQSNKAEKYKRIGSNSKK